MAEDAAAKEMEMSDLAEVEKHQRSQTGKMTDAAHRSVSNLSSKKMVSMRSAAKAMEGAELGMDDETLMNKLREETRASVPDRYVLNAGISEKTESHFLSWDYMLEHIKAARPAWQNEEGETVPTSSYQLDTGMHVPSACCEGKCCQSESDFAKFGVGTALYFKYLKFMMVLFLVMSLCAIPSMVFWRLGTHYSSDSRDLLIDQSAMNVVYFLSMGSWGGPQYFCDTISGDEGYTVKCESGTIRSINLHYGTPGGYCTCPAVQQPHTDGSCPSKYEYGPDNTKSGSSCCSSKSTSQGLADLSDVNPYAEPSCSSSSAAYIAHGLCVGKTECYLNASASYEYTWSRSESACSPYDTDEDDSTTCVATFLDRGNFTGCTDSCDFVSYTSPWDCDDTSSMELTVEGFCQSDTAGGVDKKLAALIIASLDAAMMLIFWAMILWLDKKQTEAAELVNSDVCTAADYTVQIMGLPRVSDHSQLKKDLFAHFKRVLNEEAPPVKDSKVVCDVVDINFAIAAESNAIYYRSRVGALALKLERLMTQIMLTTQNVHNHGKTTSAELEYLHKRQGIMLLEFMKLQKNLEKAEDRVADDKRVSAAFVTFNSEEAYVRCRRLYPSLGAVFTHLTQSKELRLQNYPDVYDQCRGKPKGADCHGFRLEVHEAPEPDDILWENFGMDTAEVVVRRSFTILVTLVCLLVSFAMIYLAQTYQAAIQAKYPSAPECPTYVHYDVDANATYYAGQTANDLTVYDVVLDREWEYYNLTTGNTGLLGCMCDDMLINQGLTYMLDYKFYYVRGSAGGIDEDKPDNDGMDWCQSYYTDQLLLYSIITAASIVVTAINICLTLLAAWCGDFNRYTSLSSRSASVTIRLFIATFFNTALLTVAINGNLFYFPSFTKDSIISFGPDYEILGGDYSDFSPDWYLYVSIPLVQTILISKVIVEPLTELAMWAATSFKRFKDRKFHKFSGDVHITKQTTQEDLNRLYTGPEFKLKNRYATQLTLIFTVVLYSAAIPVLWFLAFLAFAVWLVVDKVLFVNFYERPPQLDGSLADLAAKLYPYAVAMHLAFSMWMFSNDDIFDLPSDDDLLTGFDNSTATDDDELLPGSASSLLSQYGAFSRLWSTENNALTLVVFVIVLLHLIFRDLLIPLLKQSTFIFTFLPCLRHCVDPDEDWEDNLPYIEAIHPVRLQYGVDHPETLSEEMVAKYRDALSKAGKGETARLIDPAVIESYNFTANTQYADKFHTVEANLIRQLIEDGVKLAEKKGEDFEPHHTLQSFHKHVSSRSTGLGESKTDEPSPETVQEEAAPAPAPEPEPEPAPKTEPAPTTDEPAPPIAKDKSGSSKKLVPLPTIDTSPAPPAPPASSAPAEAPSQETDALVAAAPPESEL